MWWGGGERGKELETFITQGDICVIEKENMNTNCSH